MEGLEGVPRLLLREQLPYLSSILTSGKIFRVSSIADLPPEAGAERAYAERSGIKSNLSIPIQLGGKLFGAISLGCFGRERQWPDELVGRLRLVGEVLFNALARQRAEETLARLQQQLQADNLYLQEEIRTEQSHGEIIGRSRAIRTVLKRVEQVAPTDSSVLLSGETGTGKELVARAIHDQSSRRGRAMIRVNCAALPSTLVESELFGREKGAFTGALTSQAGRFEMADGSTLFLDEVGELPLELQAKLLRVLQEGEFERLGSTETRRVDVRIIAATNRDLEQSIRTGLFRQDLFYRLNVFPIALPPLRERREDIPQLVWVFIAGFAKRLGKSVESVPRRTMEQLQAYPWPGNVRELRNVIERSLILSEGPVLQVELPRPAAGPGESSGTLQDLDRQHILDVLGRAGWRIRGRGCAAEILGLKPTTLEARMRKLGIQRPK